MSTQVSKSSLLLSTGGALASYLLVFFLDPAGHTVAQVRKNLSKEWYPQADNIGQRREVDVLERSRPETT